MIKVTGDPYYYFDPPSEPDGYDAGMLCTCMDPPRIRDVNCPVCADPPAQQGFTPRTDMAAGASDPKDEDLPF